MNKTIKLTNWKGEEHYFEVEDVEEIVAGLGYEISGDQCIALGYSDGELIVLDSGADTRQLGFGPENTHFFRAQDIPWEVEPYAA